MFRYPGGKRKLRNPICSKLEQVCSPTKLYVEPFFGTGAVALDLIKRGLVTRAALNDYDYSITCVWNAVLKRPDVLKKLIKEFKPSVNLFYSLKEFFTLVANPQFPRQEYEIELLAAKKILLHQMSYSGLGVMAGGPIGGKGQKSKYDVACRWSPDKIIADISLNHDLLSSIDLIDGEVSCLDFRDRFNLLELNDSVLYLDPPYFEKGGELYLKSFGKEEHDQLFDLLDKLKDNTKWVLSYDNHVYVLDKYSKYVIETLNVTYSINGANYAKEILISNFLNDL